jgi:hypothetical protein
VKTLQGEKTIKGMVVWLVIVLALWGCGSAVNRYTSFDTGCFVHDCNQPNEVTIADVHP